MNAILNMTVRDALRTTAAYLIVGVILWLPAIAYLLGPAR